MPNNCKQLANTITIVERHFRTAHPDYDAHFSLGTERGQDQLTKHQHQASEQRNMFRGRMTTVQQWTTEVSYQITHKLAKTMAPLQHGELFKDCLVQSTDIISRES